MLKPIIFFKVKTLPMNMCLCKVCAKFHVCTFLARGVKWEMNEKVAGLFDIRPPWGICLKKKK